MKCCCILSRLLFACRMPLAGKFVFARVLWYNTFSIRKINDR